MKVVLAGKSRYSESFKPVLTDAGLELVAAETAAELKTMPEELPVILLYDTKLNPLITDQAAAEKYVLGLKPQDTIVFLMDHEKDANPHIEQQVFERAARLASAKRRVAVLMRSSRASDDKFDDRYRNARQKGVTFIKYETIEVTEKDEIYTIDAWDGKLSVSIDTPLCIDCAEKPDPELASFVDALRIRTYDGGAVSGNRWFLNQGTTFKRNVKFINTIALNGDVQKIVPSLVKDILALDRPGQEKTAFVETEKCAFCYTCYRVCPHSALGPDENAAAMKGNDLLCEACGICVTVCPASAITLRDVAMVEADRRSAPAEAPLKIFCCENSALVASEKALAGMDALVEPVPCGGDVSAAMMTEALKSHDKVMVAVCCDDACKHRDGNKRCIKQLERLKDRMDQLGYDSGRLSFVQTGVTMDVILRDAAEKALAGGEEK